jgi:hypothetical protein
MEAKGGEAIDSLSSARIGPESATAKSGASADPDFINRRLCPSDRSD